MKSSRKKFRSGVGSGATVGGISVGGISVGVSAGIVAGTAVGLNTNSGVGVLSVEREVKLQAGRRIIKTMGQNFRVLKVLLIKCGILLFYSHNLECEADTISNCCKELRLCGALK